jgi:adenosylcobinamide-GDP ribazoletransferase
MKGLIVAIQFLTRLPTPRLDVRREEFVASIRWFPAVGFIIGALLFGAVTLARPLGPWVSALAGLVTWVAVTGALHLDGLGDIADGSGAAHKDKDQLLAVLADPHMGSFGTVAIALQLIIKLVLLHAIVESSAVLALIFIPFAARMGPLVWAVCLPSLHKGLGDMFRPAVTPMLLMLWGTSLHLSLYWLPSLIAAPVFFGVWALWIKRRIGGISGDGHGAGIEWGESCLMLAVLIIGLWL